MKRGSLILAVFLSLNPLVWASDKESYLKKTESEINAWSAKVDRLQKRAEKTGAKTRAQLDRQIKSLQEKLDKVRRKLSELQGSSEGTWKSLSHGADEGLRDVKQAYKTATSFLNKSENKEKP